jgi:hypothetical protein
MKWNKLKMRSIEMSKVADLTYDIEQLYIDGHSARMIALILECPIEVVLGQLQEMGVADSQQEDDEIYSPYYGA